MYTLGINAAFHDSAAVLVRDGLVVAAAEDERFTRVKHGKRPVPFSAYELPFHAIDFCLSQAGIRLVDVDHIAYSYDPSIELGAYSTETEIALPLQPSAREAKGPWDYVWQPLFLSYIVNAPRHLAGGAPHHLRKRFLGAAHNGPYVWHFVEHHLAHAASAFLPSPFESAAILTLDGRGEKATTTYGRGEGRSITRLAQVDMPHSLGIFYEKITEHLGFLHASDEYKVMALASYGKPAFVPEFREMVRVGEGGQYRVEAQDLSERIGPARLKGDPIEERHCDIAHSLQFVLEEAVLRLASWLHGRTRSDDLCLAGGVALNCVLNSRLLNSSPFKRIWVQPAAGDAGTALGAALVIDGSYGNGRAERYGLGDVFLGPQYDEHEIESFFRWSNLPVRRMSSIADETARLLADNKIVGWFQGRMEFGPRALGARSILATPMDASVRDRLNAMKEREDFRPVAPAIIEEEASEWFEAAGPSPFMLFVFTVKPDKKDIIPSAVHIDGTSRIQTVNREQNALYYDLLKAFQTLTGVPVLINTSFNVRGEPIVCTPKNAVESFFASPLDALVIGPYLLTKSEVIG